MGMETQRPVRAGLKRGYRALWHVELIDKTSAGHGKNIIGGLDRYKLIYVTFYGDKERSCKVT